MKVTTDKGARTAAGTIFGHHLPRIVMLDGYRVGMIPQGNVVVCFNDDRPGVIGAVGDAFGQAGINIAYMTVGRETKNDKAVLALNLDAKPSSEVLDELRALDFMNEVYPLALAPLPESQQGDG